MPEEHVVHVDPFRPLGEEPGTGHNRWHEAIEPVTEVDPGDTVIYETRDAFDVQLNWGSTEDDVAGLNLNPLHPLTGPVYVKGAEPGDLLGGARGDRGGPMGAVGIHHSGAGLRLPARRVSRTVYRSLAAA